MYVMSALGFVLSGNAFCQQIWVLDRFEISFTDHAFECVSGDMHISVGVFVGGDNKLYEAAKQKGLTLPDYSNDLTVYVQKENAKHKTVGNLFSFWGAAKFEDADKKVTVNQAGGHVAYFERFGSTPEWPYKSKKDSQYFFIFKLDDGLTYKCKAVPNADE